MSGKKPMQALLAVFDKAASAALCEYLRKRGCACTEAETWERARSILREEESALVLMELVKGAVSLDQVCEQVQAKAPGQSVVVLAAPNPDVFFEAAKAGAAAVLSLPLDPLEYMPKLEALTTRARPDTDRVKTKPDPEYATPRDGHKSDPAHIPSLFATSEEMSEVRELIAKVAPTSATVLIRGESGVGKELAARLIHGSSLRSHRPLVKVNCAAIPNELLESELFGYEAGAFTGAVRAKPGKFELADSGTIFLDEIGEMHPVLQAKLLHVLQDGEFARLGAKRDLTVDVRVICATNKPLDVLVANGQFREDLFYRINVVTVSLPPLRSRRREIPVLIDYFVRRFAKTYSKPMVPMGETVVEVLTEYGWPGNIRELENLCKRYVIVGNVPQMLRELEHKQREPTGAEGLEMAAGVDLAMATNGTSRVTSSSSVAPESAPKERSAKVEGAISLLDIGRRAAWIAERTAIEATLRETRWNRREAARRLHVSYKALLNKIHQMKVEAEDQHTPS